MRAVRQLALLVVLAALSSACKKKSPEEAGETAASAHADAAPPPPRCSEGSASFSIGDRTASADAEDAGDDLPLPFAVEIGAAVSTADGFAVAALRSQKGGTGAVVALVGRDAGSGRIVELGRTFGDAEPPRLASRGGVLVAAVPDNDAGGGTLRLATIKGSGVTWGAEIPQGRDESRVFDVELGEKRGVLVWDDYDKKAEHGVVSVASFDALDLGNATRPRPITREGDDAEAPELVARKGGYWLAWISRSMPERAKPKPAPKKDAAKKAAAAGSEPPPDDPVVEMGRRWLRIAPLDENGALSGEPRDVTGHQAHVMVFDLASLPDGSALLAWRDDAASPGVEAGAVHLARVAPGGAIDVSMLEDDKIGAGIPSLIVDRAPPEGAAPLWLALGSVTDATRLVALGREGRVLDELADEPSLGRGEPLSVSGGQLLVARPRGLAIELSVARCRRGPAPDAGAPDAG